MRRCRSIDRGLPRGRERDSRRDLCSSCGSCCDATIDSSSPSSRSQDSILPPSIGDQARKIAQAAANVDVATWQCRFLARFVGKVLGSPGFLEEQLGEIHEIVARAVGNCLDLVLSCGASSRSHWIERALLKEEHEQDFQAAVEDLCKALAVVRVVADEELLLDSMDEVLADLRAASLSDLARRDRLEIFQRSKLLLKNAAADPDEKKKSKHLHQIAQTMVARIDQRGRDCGAYRINPAELHRGKMIAAGDGGKNTKAGIRVYHSRWLRQGLVEKALPVDCSSLGDLSPLFGAVHPNLVRLLGIAPRGDQGCSLVMESMGGGALAMIEERRPKAAFDLDRSLDIMLQIARGMRCLHDHKVLHMNLTTRNVLVAAGPVNRREIVVKVADFGLAKILSKMTRISPAKTTGKNKDGSDAGAGNLYSREADVRDFAAVCYEILGGDDESIVPDHIRCFLSRCSDADASIRPQFVEICEFFAMIRGLEMRKNNMRKDSLAILDDLSPDELEALVYYLGEDWLLHNAVDRRAIPQGILQDWIQDSTAIADAAKIRVQLRMGDLVADWRGREHRFLEARIWYRMAALLGDPEALWRLGMIMERGECGIQANLAQAFAFYRESAAKSYTNAIVELGRCYSIGLDVDRSDGEAEKNFVAALERQSGGGGVVPVIQELVEMAAAMDPGWASNRLVQISSCSRAGRVLVAGAHSRNLKILVAMLSVDGLDDAARYNLVKLIQNLAVEPRLLQKIVFVDGIRELTKLLSTSSTDRRSEDLMDAIVECLWEMIQRETRSKFAVYQAVRSGLVECLVSSAAAAAAIESDERRLLLEECLGSDAGAMWLEEPANAELLQAAKNPNLFWREKQESRSISLP